MTVLNYYTEYETILTIIQATENETIPTIILTIEYDTTIVSKFACIEGSY